MSAFNSQNINLHSPVNQFLQCKNQLTVTKIKPCDCVEPLTSCVYYYNPRENAMLVFKYGKISKRI